MTTTHKNLFSKPALQMLYQKIQRKVVEWRNYQDGFAIRSERKNVSAEHQTNPAQSQLFQHQLHFWGTN